MAKKTTGTSNDIYTAILAISFFAVLAAVVFVTLKCMNYYGSEALYKIAQIS